MKTKISSSIEQSQDTVLNELATICSSDKSAIIRVILGLYFDKITDESGQIIPSVKSEIETALNGTDTSQEAPDGFISRQEVRTLQSTPLSDSGLDTVHLALNFFEQNINQTPWMGLMVDILTAHVKNADPKDDFADLRIDLLAKTMELFRMLGEVVAIDEIGLWDDVPEFPKFVEQV